MSNEELIENDVKATESVITALQKVISVLDRIKRAIEESSRKIPSASVQLHTVTQATELATVEILDVLDMMGTKIHTVENGLNEFEQEGVSKNQKIMLGGIKQNLKELRENTGNISMALQVQDITAQKIGAANHLIETVRTELLNELNYFETAKKKTDSARRRAAEEITGAKSFDLNAAYRKPTGHQSKIDEVVLAWHEKENSESGSGAKK